MVDLASLGILLGGAAQAGGGLADLLGGSPSNKQPHEFQENWWDMQMAMAKKHGIHPLAALGVRPDMGPVAQPHGSAGDALTRMGQGLSRMGDTGMSEIQKAQIENIKADTRIKNMEAERIKRETPEGQGTSGITEEILAPPINPAYEGKNALENVYFHQLMNGERAIEFLPGQGAQDYLSESFVDNTKYRLMKETQGYKLSMSRISDQTKTDIRNWLDDLEMYYPPRPGYYYAWNFKAGRPREIKLKKYGKPRLFDTKFYYEPRFGGFQQWRNK